jgi:molecular chaperone GrpE
MIPEQGSQGAPQGPPGTPGREAEDVPVDGESPTPSADDDRNLTPSASAEGPADSSKVEEDITALLADTQRERDEYLELAQRTKADFENYRKRMAAEVQASSARAKAELAAGMIDVIDNLERALGAVGIDPAAEEPPAEPLAEGFLLTYRELCGVLARAGIESFDPDGEPFDPTRHEALQKVPVDGAEPGTVVETTQKGYRLGEQLIRPARVVVSA